jgi:PAS domain S-box-containing protein
MELREREPRASGGAVRPVESPVEAAATPESVPRGVGVGGRGVLPESEALYRSLIETSPDGITVSDLQGRLLLTNRRAAEMHGFLSPKEYLAHEGPGTDWIAPRDRVRALAEMRRVIEEGSIHCIEYEMLRQDGTTFPAEVNACVIRDAEGRPVGVLGIGRDVSERRRAQEELLRAQRIDALGLLAGGIAHDSRLSASGVRQANPWLSHCARRRRPWRALAASRPNSSLSQKAVRR